MPLSLKFVAFLLSPFLLVYALIIYLRNKMYDWRWFKVCDTAVSVISVGNLQIGGTGKTPMVEYLAENLRSAGKNVVILSRGYRRLTSETLLVDSDNFTKMSPGLIGDEPFQIMANVPGINLAIDADRCKSAEKALQKWPGSVFVLDDGFQHRRIARDLDIVMIDAAHWSRCSLLYPITTFRDVKSSLKRANIFIVTQWETNEEIFKSLKRYQTESETLQIFKASFVPADLIPLNTKQTLSFSALENLNVAAVCGIANPERFFNMLEAFRTNICFQKCFRDHHHYQTSHIEELIEIAVARKADVIITTQKDAVKISPLLSSSEIPFYYLKIKFDIQQGELLLNKMLQIMH